MHVDGLAVEVDLVLTEGVQLALASRGVRKLADKLRSIEQVTTPLTALAALTEQLCSEQVRGYHVETAELLDVSPHTVDQLIRDGKLRYVWAGKRRVVPHPELRRFLAAGVLDTEDPE